MSEVAPGSCPICNMVLEPSTSTRPHQDHNPKHGELGTSGNFTQIYLAALDAKDLAVALERHVGEAPAERRASLAWALRQLVRSAWLLDDYGDLGNKEKVHIAYDLFDEAVEAIRSVYE